MSKLKVGEFVRNIRAQSNILGMTGYVVEVRDDRAYVDYGRLNSNKHGRDLSFVPYQQSRWKDSLERVEPQRVSVRPERKLISRERFNVISRMTQSDMMKNYGAVQGVIDFNERCLGKTTGQALETIGAAMLNPGISINLKGKDHASSKGKHVDEMFVRQVNSLIEWNNLRGFHIEGMMLSYNPIVTEEIYVELR